MLFVLIAINVFLVIIGIIILIIVGIMKKQYKELEEEVLSELKFPDWNIVSYYDNATIMSGLM